MASPIKNSLPLDVPAPTSSTADPLSARGRRSPAAGERFGHHLDREIESHAAESRRREAPADDAASVALATDRADAARVRHQPDRTSPAMRRNRSTDDAASASSPMEGRAARTRGAETTARSLRRSAPHDSDATTPAPPVAIAPPVPADLAVQATIALSLTDRPTVEGASSLTAVDSAGAAIVAQAIAASGGVAGNVQAGGPVSPSTLAAVTTPASIEATASDVSAASASTSARAVSSSTVLSPSAGDSSVALPSAAMEGAQVEQVEQIAQVEQNVQVEQVEQVEQLAQVEQIAQVDTLSIDAAVSDDAVETAVEPAPLPADAVRALHAVAGRTASRLSGTAPNSNTAAATSTTGTADVEATSLTAQARDASALPSSTASAGPAGTAASVSAFAVAAADADAALAATSPDAVPTARSTTDLVSTADPAARRAGLSAMPLSLPSLSMDLSDEGLGPLTLQAMSGDGVVHLKLAAADPAVGTLLSRAAGELRRDLEAGGTNVGTLDVGHSASDRPGADHANSGSGSGSGSDAGTRDGRAGASATRGRPRPVSALPPTTTSSRIVSDGVDVRI